MKKKLLYLTAVVLLLLSFNNELSAQTVQLYRQAGDITDAATSFTYTTSSGGDVITYPASTTTSSSNICAPAVRRVQLASFNLNYKSGSVGNIVISGNSSGGTSSRTVTAVTVNGVNVTADVTIVTTIAGNGGTLDCGNITITGLNVAQNATTGVNIGITFDGNTRVNTISISSATLPLDFLSFTAKPDAFGKTVDLNWSTTNEVNTKNFEIQKRTDSSDFTTIGNLPSKNVAGVHHYSFTDNTSNPGNSYYRIVQYDNDGASTISKIVAVTNKAAVGLSVYPNPVEETLNVKHAAANASASFKILTADGRTVLQSAAGVSSTSSSINVSQLTSGAYLLIFDNQTDSSSIKFVKK
ncbi:T9SS type A sorting domain-containing protein [Pedobacter alpinus]|uniref:T9SS type A sorting domain-containing protein n=1 Tax=Pedobacter alpinus TaxID=1590643 RepID=A0ABW5TTZ1_9SPHI